MDFTYKLQVGDYFQLFLYLSPIEIAKEFGSHAHTHTHIARLLPSHRKNKSLLKETRRKEFYWQKEEFDKAFEEEKKEAIARVWKRINDVEAEWAST